MPELIAILEAKSKEDYENKRFLAALKGIDLDKNNKREVDPWEAMKAKRFSNGQTSDPHDILALQGYAAERAGFGIGHGLDYEAKK